MHVLIVPVVVAAALEALLNKGGRLAANGGTAHLVSSGASSPFLPSARAAAAAGATRTPNASDAAATEHAAVVAAWQAGPVLELLSGGRPLVCVSMQLRTGRLLLRAGDGAGMAASGQEMLAILRQACCPPFLALPPVQTFRCLSGLQSCQAFNPLRPLVSRCLRQRC